MPLLNRQSTGDMHAKSVQRGTQQTIHLGFLVLRGGLPQ